eukprot:gene10771-22496_t
MKSKKPLAQCSCISNNCKEEPFYDTIELRDQIRKLKIHRGDLISESKLLEQEISTLEDRCSSLRSELNVLYPVDQVRVHEVPPEVDNVDISDKKFFEANMKLEIKIITADIRSSLPALEAEALMWEERVHKAGEFLKRSEDTLDRLPAVFKKNLDEDIAALRKESAKMNVSFNNARSRCGDEVKQMWSELKRIKKELYTQNDECSLLEDQVRHVRTTCTSSGTMSAEVVPTALSPWLISHPHLNDGDGDGNDPDQGPIMISEQTIAEAITTVDSKSTRGKIMTMTTVTVTVTVTVTENNNNR